MRVGYYASDYIKYVYTFYWNIIVTLLILQGPTIVGLMEKSQEGEDGRHIHSHLTTGKEPSNIPNLVYVCSSVEVI